MVEYDKYRFKSKEKPKYVKQKKKTLTVQFVKRKHNKIIKEVALENKIGQRKSTCVDCGSRKSTFLKSIKPIKNKKQFLQITNMQIYCKNCKKHTGNTFPQKIVPISKNIIKEKPKCFICFTERTFTNQIEDKYDLKK